MKNFLTPLRFVLSFVWIFCTPSLQGQDTILLMNPSFEDIPHRGSAGGLPIKMWDDCGFNFFPGESPPDIHPVTDDSRYGSLQPQDGSTYLGLVARANGTWESVGQMLVVPLHAGACYSLTVMMAQSDNNKSRITVTAKKGATTAENNFPPARILIWGGLKECERLELLAESIDVTNHAWKAYELILSPHDDYSHIMIEVYYSKSKKEHYNGHVLIDNLSPIIAIDCK